MKREILCFFLCSLLCVIVGCGDKGNSTKSEWIRKTSEMLENNATTETVVSSEKVDTSEKVEATESTENTEATEITESTEVTETAVTTEASAEKAKKASKKLIAGVEENEHFEDVTDDMYSKLISGKLNKTQLAFMLGLVKDTGKTSGILAKDLDMYAFCIADASESGVKFVVNEHTNDPENYTCSLKEINRVVSGIIDDSFADGMNLTSVNGDEIVFNFPAGGCPSIDTNITKAAYKPKNVMYVEFTCYINIAGDEEYSGYCTAIFKPKKDGSYKLSELKDGTIEENFGELDYGGSKDTNTVASFDAVLDSIEKGTNEYKLSDEFMMADTHTYTVYDLNADGSKELVVYGNVPDGRMIIKHYCVFAIKGSTVEKVSDEFVGKGSIFVLPDKDGAYYTYNSDLTTGDIVYNKITYDGKSVTSSEYLSTTIGAAPEIESCVMLTETDISDRSMLNE